MAVTAFWYAHALENLVTRLKNIDFDTNTINVMLTTVTYVPNQDTHEDKADVTDEITGGGYAAGGVALGSKVVSTTLNVMDMDAADTQWTSATFTARIAVMYDDSGAADGDKALLLWVNFGQDESVTNGTFTIEWAAGGIATITATDAAGFP